MIGPEPNGVVAVFPDRVDADTAREWLRLDGLEDRSVSVLGASDTRNYMPPELDRGPTHRAEVASYWGRYGAVLGAMLGMGPVAVALAASTVGPGPLLTALATAAVFAVAMSAIGAFSSALFGVGAHSRRARLYERALAAGKFLVVVHTDDPVALRDARDELTTLGAESIDVHGLPFVTE